MTVLAEALPEAALYALLGAGLVVIFRTTGVLSFAQGYLALLGGYLFYQLSQWLGGAPWALPFALALAASGLVGAVAYFGLVGRVSHRQADVFVPVVATISLAWLVESAVGVIWGGQAFSLRSPVNGASWNLFGSVEVSALSLVTVGSTVVVIGGLALWLRRARFGIAMRAAADNSELVSSYGLNLQWIKAVSWIIGSGSAMLAGVAFGIAGSNGFSTIDLGFAAFPAVLLGGFDSIGGVLIGSVIVALLETVITTLGAGYLTEPVTDVVILAILLVRPYGLLGARPVLRV